MLAGEEFAKAVAMNLFHFLQSFGGGAAGDSLALPASLIDRRGTATFGPHPCITSASVMQELLSTTRCLLPSDMCLHCHARPHDHPTCVCPPGQVVYAVPREVQERSRLLHPTCSNGLTVSDELDAN